MAKQLILIEASEHNWKLDERTRETGRRGIAEAREALRRATERQAKHHGDRTAA